MPANECTVGSEQAANNYARRNVVPNGTCLHNAVSCCCSEGRKFWQVLAFLQYSPDITLAMEGTVGTEVAAESNDGDFILTNADSSTQMRVSLTS